MKNKRIAIIKRAIKIKRVNESDEDIAKIFCLADESQREKKLRNACFVENFCEYFENRSFSLKNDPHF